MKNSIVIGIVVAMAAGVVITGSTLPAVSAQGNMTAGGGGNMTAGATYKCDKRTSFRG